MGANPIRRRGRVIALAVLGVATALGVVFASNRTGAHQDADPSPESAASPAAVSRPDCRALPATLPTRTHSEIAAAEQAGGPPLADAVSAAAERLQAVLEADGTFAGLWVDQFDGVVSVAVTGNPSLVAQHVERMDLGQISVHVYCGEYTHAELRALQDMVVADHGNWSARGVGIASVAVDVLANRLAISVVDLTPGTQQQLEAAYGPRVLVTEGSWACAGVGISRLEIAIGADGVVRGWTFSEYEATDRGPAVTLSWPAGFAVHQGNDGPELRDASGDVVLQTGAVLADLGACVGDGHLEITEIGRIIRTR